ncbi:MAG: RNA chaperone Hfq [Nitrospirota bacterium]
MEINLLDRMLDTYLTGRTSVTVTLRNKIRVSGRIKAFDSYVIIMDGTKQEILFRHAVMSLSSLSPEEHKRPPATSRPALAKAAPPRPAKSVSRQPRQAQPQTTLPPSATESLNNSMKDGLLRWMQEQKAAK